MTGRPHDIPRALQMFWHARGTRREWVGFLLVVARAALENTTNDSCDTFSRSLGRVLIMALAAIDLGSSVSWGLAQGAPAALVALTSLPVPREIITAKRSRRAFACGMLFIALLGAAVAGMVIGVTISWLGSGPPSIGAHSGRLVAISVGWDGWPMRGLRIGVDLTHTIGVGCSMTSRSNFGSETLSLMFLTGARPRRLGRSGGFIPRGTLLSCHQILSLHPVIWKSNRMPRQRASWPWITLGKGGGGASYAAQAGPDPPVPDPIHAVPPPPPPLAKVRRPRVFCPVPDCPEGVVGTAAGWKNASAMRAHLNDHCNGRYIGQIPRTFLEEHNLVQCSVCSRLLSSRFGSACPRCRPALQSAASSTAGRATQQAAAGTATCSPPFDEVAKKRTSTKKQIPKGARRLWAQCLLAALASVVAHNDASSWSELYALPKWVLRGQIRGGQRNKKEARLRRSSSAADGWKGNGKPCGGKSKTATDPIPNCSKRRSATPLVSKSWTLSGGGSRAKLAMP